MTNQIQMLLFSVGKYVDSVSNKNLNTKHNYFSPHGSVIWVQSSYSNIIESELIKTFDQAIITAQM